MSEFPKFRMQSILNLMKVLIYTALVVYFYIAIDDNKI